MLHASQDNSNTLQGVLWFIVSLIIGSGNDVIAQHLTMQAMQPLTIAFFRFLFSACSLLPFLLRQGRRGFIIHYPLLHIFRGILTFAALSLWISGVSKSSVVTATLFNFTMPIFSFILAPLLLKEERSPYLRIAIALGFFGSLVTLYPQSISLDSYTVLFLLAILCFFTLDILAKKYVMQASMLHMLFYANAIATLLSYLSIHHTFTMPAVATCPWLVMLGIGGNLLLYALLKAYQKVGLTFLAPLRYLEIVVALGFNYLCFHQPPTWHEWMGMLIIIPTSFFVVYLSSADKKSDALRASEK